MSTHNIRFSYELIKPSFNHHTIRTLSFISVSLTKPIHKKPESSIHILTIYRALGVCYTRKQDKTHNSVDVLQDLQRRRDFVVIFFFSIFFSILFSGVVVLMCDLVHHVDTVHVLC